MHTNRIESIDLLANSTPRIEFIDLTGNKLKSLEGISNLRCVHTLFLASNSISSFKGISRLEGLKVLELGNNGIRRAEELYDLPSVQYLCLNNNELGEWAVGSETKALKDLRLDYNRIKRIKFVGSKGTLETFSAKYSSSNNLETIYWKT